MQATRTSSTEREERDEEKGSPSSQKSGSDGPGLAPKYSCDFLDPRLRPLRSIFWKACGLGTLLSCIAIFAVLSIYWGALFSISDKVPNLHGILVDLDEGEVGQFITSAFLSQSGDYGQLTWASRTFDNSAAVAEAIKDNQAWAAVVINRGATANLNAATTTADASYNGSSAITVMVNQARNQQALPYIQNAYMPVLTMLTRSYASQRARSLATSTSLEALLSQAPSVVTLPISYTTDNLIPFDVPAAIATTFIGSIYVTVFAFTLTMQGVAGRAAIQPYLKLSSLLSLRILAPMAGYFFLSLSYSLLNYAFQIPFYRKFGDSGFVIFWMLSYCGFLALGFALEAMVIVLTPRFVSYFLLLWIVCQVSVALYPIELLPEAYRYGYAAPYFVFSDATRVIVFGVKNKVGQDFGILLAWSAISVCTTSLLTVFCFRQEVGKARVVSAIP